MLDVLRNIRYGNGLDICLVEGKARQIKNKYRATFSVISGDVEIGEGTMIAPFCVIVSDCHRTNKSIPVRIGKNVWIGANCTITQGCIIEDGAIIGANSMLTRNTHVGKNELWGGVPAKKIKEVIHD